MHTTLVRAGALMLFALAADAAEQRPVDSVGNLLQVLVGLVVVLALMAGAAWTLKRLGVTKGVAGSVAKIVGGVSVGSRERILVVEVGEQWIVVGVAPGRVNALATMQRRETGVAPVAAPEAKNFSAWLKQVIDKRHGS